MAYWYNGITIGTLNLINGTIFKKTGIMVLNRFRIFINGTILWIYRLKPILKSQISRYFVKENSLVYPRRLYNNYENKFWVYRYVGKLRPDGRYNILKLPHEPPAGSEGGGEGWTPQVPDRQWYNRLWLLHGQWILTLLLLGNGSVR